MLEEIARARHEERGVSIVDCRFSIFEGIEGRTEEQGTEEQGIRIRIRMRIRTEKEVSRFHFK